MIDRMNKCIVNVPLAVKTLEGQCQQYGWVNIPFAFFEVDDAMGIETSMSSAHNGPDSSDIKMCLGMILLGHRAMLMTGRGLETQLTLESQQSTTVLTVATLGCLDASSIY